MNFFAVLAMALIGLAAQVAAIKLAPALEGASQTIAIGLGTSGSSMVGAAIGLATGETLRRRRGRRTDALMAGITGPHRTVDAPKDGSARGG